MFLNENLAGISRISFIPTLLLHNQPYPHLWPKHSRCEMLWKVPMKVVNKKTSEHVFHPTQTSAPTRLLLKHLKRDYYFS